MEQAGMVAWLEHCNDPFVWVRVVHAMTNEYLRWRFGIKRIVATKNRRERYPPLYLEELEFELADTRSPSVEDIAFGREIWRALDTYFKQQAKFERYEKYFEAMLLRGDGGHMPNGDNRSLGMTGGDARYYRNRIRAKVSELLK